MPSVCSAATAILAAFGAQVLKGDALSSDTCVLTNEANSRSKLHATLGA